MIQTKTFDEKTNVFFFNIGPHKLHQQCRSNLTFKGISVARQLFFVCGLLIRPRGQKEKSLFFIPTSIFFYPKSCCWLDNPQREIALNMLDKQRLRARHEPNCLLSSSLYTNSPTSLSPAQPPTVPLLLSLSAFSYIPSLGEKLRVGANFNNPNLARFRLCCPHVEVTAN